MIYQINHFKTLTGGSVKMVINCELSNNFKFEINETYPTEQQAKATYYNNLVAVVSKLIEIYYHSKQKVYENKRYYANQSYKKGFESILKMYTQLYDPFDNISYLTLIELFEQNRSHFEFLTSFEEPKQLEQDNKLLQLLNKLINNLKEHIQWHTLTNRKFTTKQMVA